MSDYDDYQPGDEYEWDQSDESQYCKHGTFIGSSWGPDILCGWCESGASEAEYKAYLARVKHDRLVQRANSTVFNEFYYYARTFHNTIANNPKGFGQYVTQLLTDIQETSNEDLGEYVS